MLLKRYGQIDSILSLGFEEGWDIFVYAIEQNDEDRIFARWLHLQHMTFKEFRDSLVQNRFPQKESTAEEAINKARDILNSFKIEEVH